MKGGGGRVDQREEAISRSLGYKIQIMNKAVKEGYEGEQGAAE